MKKVKNYLMGFNFIILFAGSWLLFGFLMFNYVNETSLEFTLFSFFGITIIIVGFFWGPIFSKIQNPIVFSLFNIPLGLCCIGFWLQDLLPLFIFLLILSGFSAITSFIGSVYYFKHIIPIYNRGKLFGFINLIYAVIVILLAFIAFLISARQFFLIYGIITLLIGGMGLAIRKITPVQSYRPETEEVDIILTKRDLIYYSMAIFLFAFTLGFSAWQVNVSPATSSLAQEAGALLIGDLAFSITGMESATLFMMIGVLGASIPSGFLVDRIGRKEMLIVGFVFSGVALTLLGLLGTVQIVILAILLEGIGLSIFLTCVSSIFIDINYRQCRKYLGYSWSSYFFGVMCGIGAGILLTFISATETAIIILFSCSIAIFSVLHAKETLPSKEEREWRDCIHHLFLLNTNGVSIIYHPFVEETLIDQDLMAGGLTGIISMIQEMTKSEDKVEVFSQKNSKLILKYGQYTTAALITLKDLKILHQKLEKFILEFEDFFHEYLIHWTGNLDLFKPADRLILRYFK